MSASSLEGVPEHVAKGDVEVMCHDVTIGFVFRDLGPPPRVFIEGESSSERT